MYFDWNEDKNKELQHLRNVCFEDFIQAFNEDKILDIVEHFNKDKYPNQMLFIIEINNYIYYVPFIQDEEKYFLKNIIPSRKLNKIYKTGG
jgi:uncharacterized DUF497 family protein